MAHRFGLAEARQADLAPPFVPAEPRRERRGFVDIDAGRVEPAGLEDQRLFEIEAAIARECGAGRRD